MRILINFATRSRPNKFLKCIQNIKDTATDLSNIDILVKADWDDESMKSIIIPNGINVEWGVSTSKIHAINRDIPTEGWDVLLNMSDDMELIPGWDNEIRKQFTEHGLDICAHWPDNCPYRERLISMSVLGKAYYDRFGYVYHSSYISLWCDNEAKIVSEKLGCYRYFGGAKHDNRIQLHRHPSHIQGLEYDEQLKKTEAFYHIDEKNYREREARNFDL